MAEAEPAPRSRFLAERAHPWRDYKPGQSTSRPIAPRSSAIGSSWIGGLVVSWGVLRAAYSAFGLRLSALPIPPLPPLPPMPASPAQPLGNRLFALRPSDFRLPYTARFTRPAISAAAASAAGLSAVASTAAVTVPSTPAARW